MPRTTNGTVGRVAKWVGIIASILGIVVVLGGASSMVVNGIAADQVRPVKEETVKNLRKIDKVDTELKHYKELDQAITHEFRQQIDQGFNNLNNQLKKMDQKLDDLDKEVKKK